MNRAWIDLNPDDLHHLLVSLIGYRFGPHPEQHVDDIRAERAAYARDFVALAGIRASDVVLDLGSGCGFGTAELARRVTAVQACDISPAFLAFAQHECAGLDNVTFHQVEPRRLQAIAGRSIDAVVSMSVFIHLNLYDIHAYFGEFGRVLKPGGTVVFDFADANRLFGGRYRGLLSRLLGRLRPHGNDELFLEHAGYYRNDPSSLPGLVQWNSAAGITGVARAAGFRLRRRRGHKLVFDAPRLEGSEPRL